MSQAMRLGGLLAMLAMLAAAPLVSLAPPAGEPAPTEPGGLASGPPPPPPPPGDAAEAKARVTLGAPQGPIDPRIYSFNVASWVPHDYWPEANATFVALLRRLDPALLRFPAGHDSQHTQFDPASTRMTPSPPFTRLLRGDQLDAFLGMAEAAGAEPLLAVNTKTGSPAMAAAMVEFANRDRMRVRWVEVGNEPDHQDRFRTGPGTEAARFAAFAAAIHAVQPEVRLVGGAFMTGANAFGTDGRAAWLEPFLEALPGTAHPDAVSWHWYPLDSDNPRPASPAFPTAGHLVQESAPHWSPAALGYAQVACKAFDRWPQVEHWVTELGPDSGAKQAPGITDSQAAAVWFASALPRLAECGADAVFQFALRQHEGSLLILMTHGREPTPAWGAYQLLSTVYRGQWVATVVEGAPALEAHAALQDGRLAVVLANRGPEPLRVAVPGLGTAEGWTLAAQDAHAQAASVNGKPLDRALALRGFDPVPMDPAAVTVPGWGVVALREPTGS